MRNAAYGKKAGSVRTPLSERRTSNSKGFTLLEVLLAVAIFAGIVAVLYGTFATSSSTVEQAEQVRDGTDAARTLLNRITTDLANAYVNSGVAGTFLYGRKAEDEETKQRFDSVFLTTLTNWRRPDTKEMELWEVGYSFQDKQDGTGRVMLRREKRELSADAPPLEGGVEYELTDAVEELRFRYYDGSSWSDEWDTKQKNKLPKAVEVLVVLAGPRVYTTQVDVGYQ